MLLSIVFILSFYHHMLDMAQPKQKKMINTIAASNIEQYRVEFEIQIIHHSTLMSSCTPVKYTNAQNSTKFKVSEMKMLERQRKVQLK